MINSESIPETNSARVGGKKQVLWGKTLEINVTNRKILWGGTDGAWKATTAQWNRGELLAVG